jgi:hypothetical protein
MSDCKHTFVTSGKKTYCIKVEGTQTSPKARSSQKCFRYIYKNADGVQQARIVDKIQSNDACNSFRVVKNEQHYCVGDANNYNPHTKRIRQKQTIKRPDMILELIKVEEQLPKVQQKKRRDIVLELELVNEPALIEHDELVEDVFEETHEKIIDDEAQNIGIAEQQQRLSCEYDPKRPTTIYHLSRIEKHKLDASNLDNVNYEFVLIDPKSAEKTIKEVLRTKVLDNSCQQNILLYCQSSQIIEDKAKTFDYSKIINSNLTTLAANSQFKNVTIYHKTNTPSFVVNMNKAVKKVVNFFDQGKEPSTMKPNTDIGQGKTFRNYPHKGNKRVYYDYRVMSFPRETDKLIENQWWFKTYTGTPLCANGRLRQWTGTCWFNTVLNSLILSPVLSWLLKYQFLARAKDDKRFVTEVEKFSLSACPNFRNLKLEDLLWITIYNLLVKGNKARREDEDFITIMAARTKGINAQNNEAYFQKTAKDFKYGEGHDPFGGLKVVLSILFPPTDFHWMDLTYTLGNPKYPDNQHPFILAMRSENKIHPWDRKIVYNNKTYDIAAGYIEVGGTHAICGFMCGDKAYTYDSNNDYVVSEDWPANRLSTKYQERKLGYIVYVRSDVILGKAPVIM